MYTCSFCGEELEEGKGIMFVKNNGEIFYFCSNKCFSNHGMRNPAKVKWTQRFKQEKEIKMKTLQHRK